MDFVSRTPIEWAILAGIFTWLSSALGAAVVFFFKKINRAIFDTVLGFTGGVMIAASFWSLLNPAIEMNENTGFMRAFPAAFGFILGAIFMFGLDKILPHLHINFNIQEQEGLKNKLQKTTLLIFAITLHNIPEGLAIGVLFGAAGAGMEGATLGAATALTLGIAIQNLPEGMAVSLPLRGMGFSRKKSFFYGQLSAIVEPIAAFLGAAAVFFFQPILPYALAFAAGAMIFVVVEEVIPESQKDKHTDLATMGFMFGFVLMMILDVSL